MFEEEDDILIDRNKNVSNNMSIPSSTQDSVNTIVNDSKAELVKNGSKEMLKGAVCCIYSNNLSKHIKTCAYKVVCSYTTFT